MYAEECRTKGIFPDHSRGKNVYDQGSRQMTSTSRRYYEKVLGAGIGPAPGMNEMFGYTEPLRRFIQRQGFEPQANEIPNTMPSWMPGEDYYTDFHKGDPYIKVDQGFARLPGSGYAALHPELEDVNPEDYPDIHKMAILADVAPYSREYNTYRLKVGKQAKDNTELQIEYEKILDRVRQTKESVVRMADRHFTWSLHPARQQNPRAGVGEASGRHVLVMLCRPSQTTRRNATSPIRRAGSCRTAPTKAVSCRATTRRSRSIPNRK